MFTKTEHKPFWILPNMTPPSKWFHHLHAFWLVPWNCWEDIYYACVADIHQCTDIMSYRAWGSPKNLLSSAWLPTQAYQQVYTRRADSTGHLRFKLDFIIISFYKNQAQLFCALFMFLEIMWRDSKNISWLSQELKLALRNGHFQKRYFLWWGGGTFHVQY